MRGRWTTWRAARCRRRNVRRIVRQTLTSRAGRLRAAWPSILQAAVAAALAWLAATELLGHERPFFAPVAAIVTLGVTLAERGRRAAEIAAGVAVGIAVADLIVFATGTGTWQLGLIVALAMAVAILLGTGQLLATQAAISAALVVTLQPPVDGVTFARFLDALVGGGIGLAVNAVLLPADPLRLLQRGAQPVIAELAATVRDVAEAVRQRDEALAEAAVLRARAMAELEVGFHDAVDLARETVRLTAGGRRSGDRLEAYATAAAQVDLAIRNVRVLARGVIRALLLDENVPPGVAAALEDLAQAVAGLGTLLEDAEAGRELVVAPAVRAAGRATLELDRTANLSVSVIVGQIRSTAVDLLRGAGLSRDEARRAVQLAASEVEAAELAD